MHISEEPSVEPSCTPSAPCEADIDEQDVENETKIPSTPYKLQAGDTIANVVAAKYGITDPNELRAAVREVRRATGIPENGIINGQTAIPHIEVNGKTLKDAYFLPETILDGKYTLDNTKAGKKTTYKKKGTKAQGSENAKIVKTSSKNYRVTGCYNEVLYEGPDASAAQKAKDDYDASKKQ